MFGFFVDGKAEKPQVLQIIKIRKLLFNNFFFSVCLCANNYFGVICYASVSSLLELKKIRNRSLYTAVYSKRQQSTTCNKFIYIGSFIGLHFFTSGKIALAFGFTFPTGQIKSLERVTWFAIFERLIIFREEKLFCV